MENKEQIESQIFKLEEKHKDSGQDLSSYLDGLLYQRYLTYRVYIHLDTLLSLQVPRTYFPYEEIFIMHHQITELYFKLILHEQKQFVDHKAQDVDFLIEMARRINSYYEAMISSFRVKIKGIKCTQFLKNRTALSPASGFQSVQNRMMVMYVTPLEHLVNFSERNQYASKSTIEKLYEHVYWKKGAADRTSGENTLTLKQFEYRFTPRLIRISRQLKNNAIYHKYLGLSEEQKNNKRLIKALKTLDINANINWPLIHMGLTRRYLGDEKGQGDATGGANWKEFLPPSFQKNRIFSRIVNQRRVKRLGRTMGRSFVQAA